MDKFTEAYIECALWASELDDYSVNEIAAETMARIVTDCAKFQEEQAELITDQNYPSANAPGWNPDQMWDADEKAGHDFWLTRNGHGAGFWDGDWSEPAATKLTKAANAFGVVDLYVGDDGKLYL